MRRNTRGTKALFIVTTAFVSACRTAAPGDGLGRTGQMNVEQAAKSTADRLGHVEIKSARVANAYEAVARLRPQFLKSRWPAMANTGDGNPVIYLDGVRQGNADMLRSIPANAVYEIRYLNGTAANMEFGRWHPGGVISVRSSPE